MLPGWPRAAVTALQPPGQRAPARYGLNYCGLGLGWDQGLMLGCQLSLGRVPGLSAVPCRASCPSTARSSGATRSTTPSSSCSGCWTACTRTWAPPRPRRGPAPPPRWVSPLSMSPCPRPQRGASAWCDRGQGPLCPPASFWQQQLSEAEATPCTPWAAPSSRVSPHCFGVPVEPSACPGSLQHPWVQQIAAGSGLGGTLAPKRCLRGALCAFPSAFRTY